MSERENCRDAVEVMSNIMDKFKGLEGKLTFKKDQIYPSKFLDVHYKEVIEEYNGIILNINDSFGLSSIPRSREKIFKDCIKGKIAELYFRQDVRFQNFDMVQYYRFKHLFPSLNPEHVKYNDIINTTNGEVIEVKVWKTQYTTSLHNNGYHSILLQMFEKKVNHAMWLVVFSFDEEENIYVLEKVYKRPFLEKFYLKYILVK